MDFSGSSINELYDMISNGSEVVSLEEIFEQLDSDKAESLADVMKVREGLTRFSLSDKLDTQEYHHYHREVPSFVGKDSEVTQTIIIDEELLFGIIINRYELINKFIQQVTDIPKNSVVNVIISIGVTHCDFQLIDAATFVRNMIAGIDCVKVFNFGSEVDFIDLMIATACDKIYISDFASVSIVNNLQNSKIPKFIYPVFKQFASFTYSYWINKGLFTAEEISEFLDSSSVGELNLLSHEIKARLTPSE